MWPSAITGNALDGDAISRADIDSKPELAWVKTWEKTGLLKMVDLNGDGKIQYFNTAKPLTDANTAVITADAALKAAAADADKAPLEAALAEAIAARDALLPEAMLGGKSLVERGLAGNELVTVNNDIMVLANPEIAALPGWVVALVAAGALAAALSTAAGLLLAISSAISHDLIKGSINPNISEKGELLAARISMAFAIALATWLGLNPPGFAAQTVALAFGLAAATIFPALMMGIFSTRINKEGAIMGMLVGLVFTSVYIFIYKGWFFIPGTNWLPDTPDQYVLGISPLSIGTIGALLNFAVAYVVSGVTKAPPRDVVELVESIRVPKGAGAAQAH
jgi:cation/acetate symporter